MAEELKFLNPNEIPELTKGKSGRDWSEIFDQIPKGKVLAMAEKDYGSSTNIRAQTKIYNEKNGEVLKARQRTNKETDETTVYVQRVE